MAITKLGSGSRNDIIPDPAFSNGTILVPLHLLPAEGIPFQLLLDPTPPASLTGGNNWSNFQN
ncbi:MAG: hypothetical protein IPH38_18515 [Candidatus Microthrix sp.]|nr:hypothetical protein [Candidatus Microthrix sp.]MBK7021528.1 hypothetical protein [Candidatus Microthrix sp.]